MSEDVQHHVRLLEHRQRQPKKVRSISENIITTPPSQFAMVTEVPSSNENSSDGEDEETAEDKVDDAVMAEAYEEENQSVHFQGSSSLTNPTPSTVSTTRIA